MLVTQPTFTDDRSRLDTEMDEFDDDDDDDDIDGDDDGFEEGGEEIQEFEISVEARDEVGRVGVFLFLISQRRGGLRRYLLRT